MPMLYGARAHHRRIRSGSVVALLSQSAKPLTGGLSAMATGKTCQPRAAAASA